ncbi:hypothetical protein TNCV_3998791 [Trichonephila clavipes]|nr:hypothetical protein TNCV_3998791 [Trichonephila clavipes]
MKWLESNGGPVYQKPMIRYFQWVRDLKHVLGLQHSNTLCVEVVQDMSRTGRLTISYASRRRAVTLVHPNMDMSIMMPHVKPRRDSSDKTM